MNCDKILDVIDKSALDNQIIHSFKPVVAVFYNKKDKNSSALLRKLQKIAPEYGNRYNFRKVCCDCEKLPDLKYEIKKLPTIVIYSKGCIAYKLHKMITTEELIYLLDNFQDYKLYKN